MAAITSFLRLEPRPRTNEFGVSLAAPIRDPLWFLTRQWQLGEFQGEDAGSIAYLEYKGRSAEIPRWQVGSTVTNVDPTTPLERQTLAEPFAADLGLRVELGQRFEELLADEISSQSTLRRLLDAFLALDPFAIRTLPDTNELAPLDAATRRFLQVCAGRSLDGYELLLLGQGVAAGNREVPDAVTTTASEVQDIETALANLVEHADAVYGPIGTADPTTWTASRLDYSLQVVAADPAGQGNFTLNARPDSTGTYDWFSFDTIGRNTAASEAAPKPISFTTIPSNVRFEGMPNPRFWMFEPNALSYVDLKPNKEDLMKVIVADFMLIHGNGWYVLPFPQQVGTLVRTDSILVHDVFGADTLIRRADGADVGNQPPAPNRWTMFSVTDAGPRGLDDWFMLPPVPGPLALAGTVVEDVRFARDETANMAWAVERVTASPVGEARSGRALDAEIDERQNFPEPEPSESGAPLRYQIESKVPAHWFPLLGVQPVAGNPSIALERGGVLRPTVDGPPDFVRPAGKVLNPPAFPYQIDEEEVPRMGTRVERVVFRSRWLGGRTHLWVQRRRLAGSGESQAGLRFDQALPNRP
jgi:hypothetical protein